MAETVNKPRIDVMVSSTFVDMKDCREVVVKAIHSLGLNDTGMEDNPAPDAHVIDASYALVDAANIYVGLFGLRYGDCPVCPKRNPKGLSLTELEFDRAVECDIPRLMFEVGDDFAVPARISRLAAAEGDAVRARHAAFRQKIADDRPLQPFNSTHDLQTMADKALEREKRKIETRARTPRRGGGRPARTEAASNELHALNAPYVMRRPLVGRDEELSRIDAWAREPEGGMLLFRAIGGMGKSALTWHWARKRAAEVRGDWAGRLWYSFYLSGATLKDFLVRALAHMTGQAAETFKVESSYELGSMLRSELDNRPWLLVLDGLERVLVAYNQSDKESMSDEEAHLKHDGLGLDRKARDCIRPEDDEILAMLAQAGKGKILMSSRLMPEALTSDGIHTILGVEDYPLEGLAKSDAARLLVNADVRTADEEKMADYLERTFACHPLSVVVLPGVMRKHRRAGPLDFDVWMDSPKGGRDPGLMSDDLRGKQNHILAVAFAALSVDDRELLASLTLMSSDLTYDIAILLNPKRPPEPEEVEVPKRKSEWEIYYAIDTIEIREAYRGWKGAAAAKERKRWQVILDRHIDVDFADQQKRYADGQARWGEWQKIADSADELFSEDLERLTDHGLIQYDPGLGAIDIHPAVRHTAQRLLSGDGRQQTGLRVADVLASRAEPIFDEVEDVSQLALVMDRVRALCAGGQLEAAAEVYLSGLSEALGRLGAFPEDIELLRSWFPNGWPGDVAVQKDYQVSALLHNAGVRLSQFGQNGISLDLALREVQADIAIGKLQHLSTSLDELAVEYSFAGRRREAEIVFSLSAKVAEASENRLRIADNLVRMAFFCIEAGDLENAWAGLENLTEEGGSGGVVDAYNAKRAHAMLRFARRNEDIDDALADEALAMMRRLRAPLFEFSILHELAEWRQEAGAHNEAVSLFDRAVALGRRMGVSVVANLEAGRARSLLAMGRPGDASRIVAADKAHAVELAELCLAIDDRRRARDYAYKGYEEAWANGPPYCHYWRLERCRKVLAALGEPEPELPEYDASHYPPPPFAAEVEALIAKTLAEEEKREAQRAARALKASDDDDVPAL